MIKVENISFEVPERKILGATNLEVPNGEFIVVLGPNGAGKSTLLKILSGFQKSTSGYLSYDGKLVEHYSTQDLAQKRSFLMQNNAVFGDFKVRDVLEMGRFPYYTYELSSFDKHICDFYTKEFDLESKVNQVYNKLSGGEQQRIQFVRSLIQLETEADTMVGKYLFLDEPLNNLDLQYQYAIMEQAKKRIVERGGTVVCILHDFNMAFQYADRVIIVDKGEVIMNDETFVAMDSELLSSTFKIKIDSYTSNNGELFFRTCCNNACESSRNKIKVQSKIK